MDQQFMQRLDELRRTLGFPLFVNSGYRCPTHNQRVSSTGPNGPHVTGRAADLRVSGTQAFQLIHHAIDLGFNGIGVAQKGDHARRFIHLDDLEAPHPRPWIWSY